MASKLTIFITLTLAVGFGSCSHQETTESTSCQEDEYCPIVGQLIAVGPCQSSFCQCASGNHWERLHCPADLVFDSTIDVCNYRSQTPTCPHTSSTTTTTTTSRTTRSVGFCKENELCPTVGELIADGPCDSSFCQCDAGNRWVKLHCPSSLVFDSRIDVCNYQSNLPSCNTSPTRAPTTTTAAPRTTTKASGLCQENAACPIVGELIANGPCESSFCQCDAGNLWVKLYCPASLVFDSTIDVCNYQSWTTSCDPTPSTTTTTTTTTRSDGLCQENEPCPTVGELIADGQCEPSFCQCDAGNLWKKLYCHYPLVFDSSLDVCNYWSDTSSCH